MGRIGRRLACLRPANGWGVSATASHRYDVPRLPELSPGLDSHNIFRPLTLRASLPQMADWLQKNLLGSFGPEQGSHVYSEVNAETLTRLGLGPSRPAAKLDQSASSPAFKNNQRLAKLVVRTRRRLRNEAEGSAIGAGGMGAASPLSTGASIADEAPPPPQLSHPPQLLHP